jgi:hypothetical protein
MTLLRVYTLVLAAQPFCAIRTRIREWSKKLHGKGWNKKPRNFLRGRHLTVKQREDISTGLQKSLTGPVSIAAAPSDREAVCFESEIANVLEETGFEVEIDNARRKPSEQETSTGLEMTIKEKTVQPIHASRVVATFRRAGIAIVTKINSQRQKNDTLYITVGPNGAPTRARRSKS